MFLHCITYGFYMTKSSETNLELDIFHNIFEVYSFHSCRTVIPVTYLFVSLFFYISNNDQNREF